MLITVLKAFVAVLVGQYVEYFYYGGKNKQHTAGHVRRTEEEMVEIQEKALDDADAPTMCSQMWFVSVMYTVLPLAILLY